MVQRSYIPLGGSGVVWDLGIASTYVPTKYGGVLTITAEWCEDGEPHVVEPEIKLFRFESDERVPRPPGNMTFLNMLWGTFDYSEELVKSDYGTLSYTVPLDKHGTYYLCVPDLERSETVVLKISFVEKGGGWTRTSGPLGLLVLAHESGFYEGWR